MLDESNSEVKVLRQADISRTVLKITRIATDAFFPTGVIKLLFFVSYLLDKKTFCIVLSETNIFLISVVNTSPTNSEIFIVVSDTTLLCL